MKVNGNHCANDISRSINWTDSLILTSLLVWDYLRSPASRIFFFEGYLRWARIMGQWWNVNGDIMGSFHSLLARFVNYCNSPRYYFIVHVFYQIAIDGKCSKSKDISLVHGI
jgi:hypothetical protein